MFKSRRKKSDAATPPDQADLSLDKTQHSHDGVLGKPDYVLGRWPDKRNDKNAMTRHVPSSMKQHRQSPPTPLPPLSPASSTSDTVPRTSAGSDRQADQPAPGWSLPLLSPKQRRKEEDEFKPLDMPIAFDHPLFADTGIEAFTKGPPIIPRSRTPPPPQQQPQIDLQKQLEERQHEKNKMGTIFDSDDESDRQDFFFKDFSPDVSSHRKSKRYTKRQSEHGQKGAAVKLDLAAFANHLYENRLSIMQVRKSHIQLDPEDENELIRLLEKRKSMAQSAVFSADSDAPPLPESAQPPANTEQAPSSSPTQLQEEKETPAVPAVHERSNSDHEDKHSPGHSPTPSKSMRGDTPQGEQHKSRHSDEPKQKPAATGDSDHDNNNDGDDNDKPAEQKRRLRKSISMDAISQMSKDAAAPVVLERMKPIKEETVTESQNQSPSGPSISSPLGKPSPQLGKPAKPIGLFGSLRQASRNRSHGSLRGLVRNLSSAGYYRHRQQQAAEQDGSMSLAARAVMEHEAIEKKQRQQSEPSKQQNKDTPKHNDSQKQGHQGNGPVGNGNSYPGGSLITSLLAKASKSRRTKKVNMDNKDKKSRVVRRTIIYVPQDSANFMQMLQKGTPLPGDLPNVPPVPPLKTADVSKGKSDETPYYDDSSIYDYYRDSQHLEGLELREMCDGTVEWGILKKQGNRKSVYVPQNDPTAVEYVDEEDEDQIEQRVLNMMGYNPDTLTHPNAPPPVPRRSPRRRADSQGNDGQDYRRISTFQKGTSTTDVYFAPQQTLPSLLQMIANSTCHDEKHSSNASVEEQLDLANHR